MKIFSLGISRLQQKPNLLLGGKDAAHSKKKRGDDDVAEFTESKEKNWLFPSGEDYCWKSFHSHVGELKIKFTRKRRKEVPGDFLRISIYVYTAMLGAGERKYLQNLTMHRMKGKREECSCCWSFFKHFFLIYLRRPGETIPPWAHHKRSSHSPEQLKLQLKFNHDEEVVVIVRRMISNFKW